MPNRKNVLRMDQAAHQPAARDTIAISELEPAPDEWVYALDIGTRTIIGVVGVQRGAAVEVLGAHVVEHNERAMMDGQIHDISKVAHTAREVTETLSRKLGRRLGKVAIAAAGRVLKTMQVQVEREIEPDMEIDAQLVGALEMEGIRKAQDLLAAEMPQQARSPFHCVGYSVVQYLLDDMPMMNLLGHKGTRMGLDVLATFLPHVVVDSLHTVMERVGLQVTSMTLEPIAALNVAIPRDLRMLNLALVDVGAGTSDIAITKGGTVVAYAMVPMAGDEISECIAQHYLVDFKTAEQVKLSVAAGQERISFLDILDNELHVAREDVLALMRPTVEALAKTLAEKMTDSNGGRSPNAVFLVGGGSQTPELAGLLASTLGLAPDRVAVRNRSIAKTVQYEGALLQGPECITPFGILVTAFAQAGRDFFHVFVEDRRIRLYNARRMTISDALLLAGYVPDQLIGKSGKSITITCNGTERVVRGGFGKPAVIERNGFPAGLTTTVSPGDHIHLIEAERGTDATTTVADHLSSVQPIVLVMSNARYEIPFRILRNGSGANPDTPLLDGDSLDLLPVSTVREVAGLFEIPLSRFRLTRAGEPVSPEYAPQPGDELVCEPIEESAGPASQSAPETPALSGVPAAPPVPELLDGFFVTVDGQEVFLPGSAKEHMLIDIFAHMDFQLSQAKGAVLLRLNGREAGYTDTLKPADHIEIVWQE